MGEYYCVRRQPQPCIPVSPCPVWRNECFGPATADWALIMKCIEITENHSSALTKPIKPLSPQQARLDALKRQKDNVNKALDAERKRQKVVKAQQSLQNALVEELPT